ncbi:hypothetical protein BH20ACT21_BH20ACT21_08980 [soil metagenome]
MATESLRERRADETASGLDAWEERDLLEPPRPKGLQWLGVVGPGVIVLGAAIGSGEFLLGPAAFVAYGLVVLWITGVATVFQTIYNQELMRYTMYTGEPAFTGFMRTKPSSTFWAWVYTLFYFFQTGIPGWAAAAAGAIYFLFAGEIAAPGSENTTYFIAVGAYLACVLIVLRGKKIEHTLEILNWVMVSVILTGFLLLVLFLTSPSTWVDAIIGYVGVDRQDGFNPIPPGIDPFLIGAVAGYAAAGGVVNLSLSNWARDKGYGMGSVVGYIPAAVGGEEVHLAHSGYVFDPQKDGMMERWKGWWRIVAADQWGVFFVGAMLGMALPAIIYVTFIPSGESLESLGVAAALADAVRTEVGGFVAVIIALMAAWLLFKTQLDILEGMVRGLTDILWTGNKRLREAGDVRKIYYSVLAVVIVVGLIILRLPQPLALLALSANMAGVVFLISSIHLLRINTRFLPKEIQPSMFRRVMLVLMAVFYGIFVFIFLFGGFPPNTDTGFAFNFVELMTKTE